MITIKSVEIGEENLSMKSHNGVYYILHNDLPIANSTEFNFISSLFDDLFIKIKRKKDGKN